MKKGVRLAGFFLMLLGCITVFSCSQTESSLPMDSDLVGQWEGISNADSGYPSIITITAENDFMNIQIYPDDESHGGNIEDGEKGTIEADGSNLKITITHEFGDDGKVRNWLPVSGPGEVMEAPYTISADGSTLTVHINEDDPATPEDEEEIVTLFRGTPPAPDTDFTGTWVAHTTEDLDDNEITTEHVTMTATLAADGSFTMVMTYDEGGDSVVRSESGYYGVYRSVEGKKYFVPITTSIAEESDPAVTCFNFMRMLYFLNKLTDPDELHLESDGDSLIYYRQGTDPGIPSPDAALCGYWQGTEEHDGTDYDVIIKLNSDNSFERIVLNPQGEEGAGEMVAGERGQFMNTGNNFIAFTTEQWNKGEWIAEAGDPFEALYSVSNDVLTLTTSEGEVTFDAIPEPTVQAELLKDMGWYCNTTEDYDDDGIDENVMYMVYLANDGAMSVQLLDTEGDPYTDVGMQYGTWGVSTIDGIDYFTLTITSMDDYPLSTTEPYYWVQRYPFELNSADMFTLTTSGGPLVFEEI